MMEFFIGILGFLLDVVLFLSLRYGYHHHNKLIKIYSICAIVWTTIIFVGGMKFFGVVLPFYELNILFLILPLIPLWIFYKFARSERERRAEEDKEYRERMGIGKTPEEHMKHLRDKGVITEEYYTTWAIKEGIIKPPPPKPPTEAQKRQWALEKERKSKEAFREAEKLVKGFTDRELIDKYIEWDEFLENTAGFGLTEGAGVEEWETINDELKRRNISSRGIETRRKELHDIWEKKYYQDRPEERLIQDYAMMLMMIDVGKAIDREKYDLTCAEIKRRGITDKQIKKERKKLKKVEKAYRKRMGKK